MKQDACGITTLIVFGLFAGAASQAQQSPHEGHSNGRPVPLEILQRPVTLRTGIGELHEKVSTRSPEAQSFYDQGLAYMHSYVWIEAARSFHQALRLDPNLAMAYLGLTDAFIGLQDVATARATLEHAKSLEKGMSERERTWLSIREGELQFAEGTNPDGYTAYRKAINEALKEPEIVAGLQSRGQNLPPANMNLEAVHKMVGEKIEGAQRSIREIATK